MSMNESEEQEMEELLHRVETGDVDALALILEKYSDAVQVRNVDRSVLIVDGCASDATGEAYRSAIQLTGEQFRSLAAGRPST